MLEASTKIVLKRNRLGVIQDTCIHVEHKWDADTNNDNKYLEIALTRSECLTVVLSRSSSVVFQW
jgi:hypothetical protein